MPKAKNIYFLLIKKKRDGPWQSTFPYNVLKMVLQINRVDRG